MKIFGAILLAIGILIAGSSGLCSLVLLAEPGGFNADGLSLVAIFGGIPFLIGAALAFAGYKLARQQGDD